MSAKLLPLTMFVHVQDDELTGRAPVVSPHFSSKEADLILSSSDSVQFRVFKVILAEASPIFRSALSSFQQSNSDRGCDELPVLDVAEHSSIVEALLRFIFPVANPTINDLDQLQQLLTAAQKYEISVALEGLRMALVSPTFVDVDPVRVYAIACKFSLPLEARMSSRYTLSVDILQIPHFEELSQITATDYLRLVRLHQNRIQQLLEQLDSMLPLAHGCGSEPRWWTVWKDCTVEELKKRPTSKFVFDPTFVMSCVKRASKHCKECSNNFMSGATSSWLAVLKARVDALPDTI